MRVLLVGGCGFIGSSLAAEFRAGGHDVHVIDSFIHQYDVDTPTNIEFDLSYRKSTFLNGIPVKPCCITERVRIEALMEELQPECVIHLAAIPLAGVATIREEAAARIMSHGLTNVLEVCRRLKSLRRFVYVSSSMVYGSFKRDPMPEDGPLEPMNIYGGLKLAGEVLTRSYLRPTDAEVVVVRPSCVYGPADLHNRVVRKFCEGALNGTPLKLNAQNDHTMDFTFISDITQGLYLASTLPEAADETFNITYGQARRLSDLVRLLRQITPNISTSSEEIADSDRPTRGTLDISKARDLLGYKPDWPLERGIPAYIDWLRSGAAKSVAV